MNLDHLVEYVELYSFNDNVYYKKATTSQKDFIKRIIEENYKECIKLVYGEDIGITLDASGNELCISNGGGPFYVDKFNVTYQEYHELIEEINNYKTRDPSIVAKECWCDWERSQYLNPHPIKHIDLKIYYYEDQDGLFKSEFYEMLSESKIIEKKMYSNRIIMFIENYITQECKIKINIL